MSKFNRRWFSVLAGFACLMLVLFAACSKDDDDKDNNPADGNGDTDTYSFNVTFNGQTHAVDLYTLPVVTIETLDAVKMSSLVDTVTTVTAPINYAYRIIGSDGFYAHQKGANDNNWAQIQGGYIILSTKGALFDAALGLPGRYNIKDAAEMNILRKIDFVTAADSTIQYVIGDLTAVTFQDTLSAVPLTSLIPAGLVANPAAYNYKLVASDGFVKTVTYAQLQVGYFVMSADQVQYSDASIKSLRVRSLNKIVAVTP